MPTLRLGAVKPHVQAAADEIAQRFNIWTIGGYRSTGSVPNSDHPKGLAIDVMTVAKGDMVAAYAIANASRLSVTYIIWNRRIWEGGNWASYSGPSPHTDHVHISFAGSAGPGGAPVESNSDMDERQGCLDAFKTILGL